MTIQKVRKLLHELSAKRSVETQKHIAFVIEKSELASENSITDKYNFIKRLDDFCPDEDKLRRVINMLAEEKRIYLNPLNYISSVIISKYNNFNKQKEYERKIYGTLPPLRKIDEKI